MRAARPLHYFCLAEADETSSIVPYYTHSKSREKFPCCLKPLTLDEFSEEKQAWDDLYGESFEQDPDSTPKAPLNPGQRDAARWSLLQIRAASKLNVVQEEPGTTAANTDSAWTCEGQLITGAAGTGKSFMTDELLKIMDHENLGTSVSASYTGVATLLMPLPRGTICTLLSIPGNCSSKELAPMTQQQRLKFVGKLLFRSQRFNFVRQLICFHEYLTLLFSFPPNFQRKRYCWRPQQARGPNS